MISCFYASAARFQKLYSLPAVKTQVSSPAVQGSPTHLRRLQMMTKVCLIMAVMAKKNTDTFEKEPTSEDSLGSASELREITSSMLGQGGTSSFRDRKINTANWTLPGTSAQTFVLHYNLFLSL